MQVLQASLGAEAITAIAGGLPSCDGNSQSAVLAFDGVSYSPLSRVLALDNIPSLGDGNNTTLILNRIGGDLRSNVSTLGSLSGVFYNDAEVGVSFNFSPNSCQFRSSVTNNFPRITPRFDAFVPALRELNPDVLVVTGDHSTPSVLAAHGWQPVPVLVWSRYCGADPVTAFTERACAGGALGVIPAHHLMPIVMANALRLTKFGA